MKQDLVKNLNGSIGTLEKEILQVKAEQGKLESLGKTSESEQKRIDQALAHSMEMLKQYKEQWNRQMEAQQKQMNEMVEKQVQAALKQRKDEQEKESQKQQKAVSQAESAAQKQMQSTFDDFKQQVSDLSKSNTEQQSKLVDLQAQLKQRDQELIELRNALKSEQNMTKSLKESSQASTTNKEASLQEVVKL